MPSVRILEYKCLMCGESSPNAFYSSKSKKKCKQCICRDGRICRNVIKQLKDADESLESALPLQLPVESEEITDDNQVEHISDCIQEHDDVMLLREEMNNITSLVEHIETTVGRLVVVAITNKLYLEGSQNPIDTIEMPDDITFNETGRSLSSRIAGIESKFEGIIAEVREECASRIAAMKSATNSKLAEQALENERTMRKLVLQNEQIMVDHRNALEAWAVKLLVQINEAKA